MKNLNLNLNLNPKPKRGKNHLFKRKPESGNNHLFTDRKPQHGNSQPRGAHQPQVNNPTQEQKYVLTLLLTRDLQKTMNAWRVKYYPPSYNRVPAHVTLFHALPHTHLRSILNEIEKIRWVFKAYRLQPGRPYTRDSQVGVACHHPDYPSVSDYSTLRLQRTLKSSWNHFLSEQDQSVFRAHWTISKMLREDQRDQLVDELTQWQASEQEPEAMRLFRSESSAPAPTDYRVLGLTSWRFEDRGTWADPRVFPFSNVDWKDVRTAKKAQIELNDMVQENFLVRHNPYGNAYAKEPFSSANKAGPVIMKYHSAKKESPVELKYHPAESQSPVKDEYVPGQKYDISEDSEGPRIIKHTYDRHFRTHKVSPSQILGY